MSTSHTILAELLNKELDALNQFAEILQNEQSQLVSASVDTLEPLIPQKIALISKVEQLSQSRYRELGNIGLLPNEHGMRTWLDHTKSHPESIVVEKEWNELLAITQTAKELNRVNGLLIASHMQRNAQALNILHANAGNSVYGPNGQQKHNLTKIHSVITG